MVTIVENVVYQHAENVCSLWLQRQNAVDEPHYLFSDLVHLDKRLESNLEGLRIAGPGGFPIVDEFIGSEDEGAIFMKSLLALERGDKPLFLELVEQSEENEQMSAEIQSALAWVKPEQLAGVVQTLLASDKSASIIIGLSTCCAHNRPPGSYVDSSLVHSDSRVRAKATQLVANLGLVEQLARLRTISSWETDHEQYEYARAMAFLGDERGARTCLERLATGESDLSSTATNLAVELGDKRAGLSLLKRLDNTPGRERDVVRGFGLLGDPVSMNWLIEKTHIPDLSRLAGGSITMITGIDLAETDLETLDEPEGFEDGGLNDDPEDDNVALDEDEDLPWPDPGRVAAWWNSSVKLPAGKYFLDGRERTPIELQYVVRNSMQRQRNAAANGLALATPQAKFMDTRLPTSLQKAWMS